MADAYDVIVIGAGMGGLATAALAARRGLRPLVLDQASAPGGACASVVRRGYRFDAGTGLLWGFEEDGGIRGLTRDLGLAVEAVPVDPGIQVALPRHRFGFHQAEERFRREVEREFPGAAHALGRFLAGVRELDEALRSLDLGARDLPPRTLWRRLQRWPGRSREERRLRARARQPLAAVPAWGALPADLQRALALVMRHLGHADASAPEPLAASLLALTRRGFVALRGGAGSLVAALVGAVERAGGTVRAGTRVSEVVVRGRRAAGVRTADGAVFEARSVVAAVAPGLLADDLLRDGARAFPEGRPVPDVAALTLYLGVDEAILPAEMGLHVLAALGSTLEPGGIDALAVSASPPWDGGRAPAGRRALTVNALCPMPAGRLEALDWGQVGERVLAALEDLLPGLRGRLDFCEVRTPAAWQEQTGRPHGAAGYARATLPVFLGWQGFPHTTPLPGLFVAGDWTFPGPHAAAVAEGARRTAGLLAASRR